MEEEGNELVDALVSFRSAAANNHVKAQQAVAEILLSDPALTKEQLEEAKKWLNVAAEKGEVQIRWKKIHLTVLTVKHADAVPFKTRLLAGDGFWWRRAR